MQKLPEIVLFHGQCYDGLGAAWAIEVDRRARNGKEILYIPVEYNKPLPPADYRCELLYIVDFSLPPEQLDQLSALAKKIVIIDHHKSAEGMLKDIPKFRLGEDVMKIPHHDIVAHFDMSQSGAVLTWKHFEGMVDPPTLLRYIEDRDIWKWELAESESINAYIGSLPFTFNAFDHAHFRLLNEFDSVVQTGVDLIRYRDKLVQSIIQSARMTSYSSRSGGSIPCVAVRSSVLQSEVGHALCKVYPEAKFAIIYSDIPGDPHNIKWSLRSEGEFDITTIAKEYGGGGHRNAGGMTTPTWRMV